MLLKSQQHTILNQNSTKHLDRESIGADNNKFWVSLDICQLTLISFAPSYQVSVAPTDFN